MSNGTPPRASASTVAHEKKKRHGRSRNARSCHCRTSPDMPSGARIAGWMKARHLLIWIDCPQPFMRWNVQQWQAPLHFRVYIHFPWKEPYQQKRGTPEKTHAANLSLGLMLRSRAIGIFPVKEQQKSLRWIFSHVPWIRRYVICCVLTFFSNAE